MPDTRKKIYNKYAPINMNNVNEITQWPRLAKDLQEAVKVVSTVFPFRTNHYIVNELIDWDNVPKDPIFQLTFPQPGMLASQDYDRVASLLRAGAEEALVRAAVDEIRARLNPHPAGQLTHNVAYLNGEPLGGVQHKYDETVLFFPSQAQTCHAYCTFCFRWAQFVGIPELKIASREIDDLLAYLAQHHEVSDLLITGGDPMFMKAELLARYIDRLLDDPAYEHIRNIRIGTKSLAYWPFRYTTDNDADEVLRLFEKVVASGKQLAVMAHYNHWMELSTPVAQEAIRRIRATGAMVRMQSPVVRHINDKAEVWVQLWRLGVRLGLVPYYMFVERDTGAKDYFELPLVRAWEIFREAYSGVSGLARTVRGPSMSAFPGKVRINGVTQILGRKVFVLEYLQARDAQLVGRPFMAKFDPQATWYTQLEPAASEYESFFPSVHDFEEDMMQRF